jgi:hypothetical protein
MLKTPDLPPSGCIKVTQEEGWYGRPCELAQIRYCRTHRCRGIPHLLIPQTVQDDSFAGVTRDRPGKKKERISNKPPIITTNSGLCRALSVTPNKGQAP